MMADPDLDDPPIAHAQFAPDGRLVTATPGFLPAGLGGIEEYLAGFALLDGRPADDGAVRDAAVRWRAVGLPLDNEANISGLGEFDALPAIRGKRPGGADMHAQDVDVNGYRTILGMVLPD